ncbi:hypothetical protein G9A89_014376 [Geosiphon pyriformis]|nr:hypothetical protein G9A89_014376 [Geosiphon pyriformis]
MTQFTPFGLVYGKKTTLPIEQVILSYPTETINEKNFEATLYQRTYQLMETLENNRRTAADNISHAQEQQKERHNKHLSEQPMEFKIGDQVLLYCTKAEKQWNGKFDPKWDGLFHIHERYDTKIRAGEGRMRVQLELNVPSPTHYPKGNVGGKIAFMWEVKKKETKNEKKLKEIKEALAHETKLSETGEWTPNNTQKWKKRLPPAYWFYKIGEQLDLKTPYENLSQKIFNKEAIQQFKDLQKAILEATIKHYMNKATITDTYSFTGAQF